jgi:diaminopimelate decarboxylase
VEEVMIAFARKTAKQLWLSRIRSADRRRRRELGMEETDLAPSLWDATVNDQGHLVLGGMDATHLADEFGTPLHVVDKGRLRKNYVDFRESFRRHYPYVEIGYSYKTNPLPGVLRSLHEFGASAEVISHFELWLALKLGVPPERVIFNGPAKTTPGLSLAVSRGVGLINIDNLGEIDTIQRLASDSGRIQKIGVRVITSVGWSSQFGLSIREGAARKAFEAARHCQNIEPCGLHIHLGTGIKDLRTYVQAIREVLDFSNELRDKLRVEIRFFDFGGGFGVPTVRPFSLADSRLMANGYSPLAMDLDTSSRLGNYGSAIAELFLRYRPLRGHDDPVMILEPGRAITSSAQTLLLQVLAIKPTTRGRFNVILDGGKNIAMPPGYEYHEILPASKMLETRSANCDLFGPLCHPGDVLSIQKRMPRFEPGDVVAVMDAGAYFVPNQMNFSNPRPSVVMVHGGTAEVIRRRECFEDIVRLDDTWGSLEQGTAVRDGQTIVDITRMP